MTIELVQEMPIGLNVEALEDWIEHRKEQGRPMTNTAIKRLRNRLMQYPEDIQERAVELAMVAGWQGVFPEKEVTESRVSTRETSLRDELTDRSWSK